MSAKVNPIPDGYHSVTPYFTVKGAAAAIDFYKKAFGAAERYRLNSPDGKVAHAEIQVGNSIMMLGDEFDMPGCNKSPLTLKGLSVGFAMYVQDVDAAFKRAVDAGATVKQAITNQFWGDRTGTVIDPYGHSWMILTHVEDVAPKEMEKRMAEFSKSMEQGKH